MSTVPQPPSLVIRNNPGLDAPITLKVLYDGFTRRVKMPLRDMVPNALERAVRAFLHLPLDAKIMMERYSDSAAAYVMLDPANSSVYKQLYRAAKAKSKVKLRVTILNRDPRSSPKPVSVEDEVETYPAAEASKSASANADVLVPTTTLSPVAPGTFPYSLPTPVTATEVTSDVNEKTWSETIDEHIKKLEKDSTSVAALASQLGVTCRVTDSTDDGVERSSACTFAPARSGVTPYAFAVCCNSCDKTIPDAHFHCSTCDDGDFDLCQSCVKRGITCHSDEHWLIKRTVENGHIVNSTTETVAPKSKPAPVQAEKPKPIPVEAQKPKPAEEEPKASVPVSRNWAPSLLGQPPVTRCAVDRWNCVGNMRTCNCCVRELPESHFVHCTTCEDYDLCQPCFAKDIHGHHPKHGFVPAVEGTRMPDHIKSKMEPGRNQMHHAICDGCDKYITGIRHKCLDCPDWDYCASCIGTAHFVHAGHRFAPVYEPLTDIQACSGPQPLHLGICCDGPLCAMNNAYPSYIRGTRYKCAVCHDVDFCANCEASPSNFHNKTHPLIKFKTPVRHVSVTTTGERQDGKRMPVMGDRSTTNWATETVSPVGKNSVNAVQEKTETQTKADPNVKTEPEPEPEIKAEPETKVEPEMKEEKTELAAWSANEQDLRAVFLHDSISDGTVLPPNHVFEQTWVLRNEGKVAWPAGCSVKFVGGDYMGHVDSAHPAGISELVSASESTVCYATLAPGQEYHFTVLLRTPARAGKVISYWRLTTPDGFKFGHRLWCEVNVRPEASDATKAATPVVKKEEDDEATSKSSSTMIFPKLEKESPSASFHEEAKTETETETEVADEKAEVEEGFDEEEWEASDDGFLTDEEYDILDASDEEFLEEQQKKLPKK
ncbi:ZZ type zinc finger domain-containing protein [Purpureocillium lavendulum]|uniref:ZZ type zinc finger domain-containing protein n=1 Tax=Purpureocillium lavendulum TaxID=1247861 RepID=A0AB34FMZ3_9HYPO|nr:ZZ type zinc finger domain-containing protein [Purpureocillium lavendulum]